MLLYCFAALSGNIFLELEDFQYQQGRSEVSKRSSLSWAVRLANERERSWD